MAVAGCLMSAAAAPDAHGAAPYPALPFVPAQSARQFGDSAGVNVRLTYLTTSYGDFDTIRDRLKELGVRYVRDGLCPTCEYQIDRLQRLAAAGIRVNLGVGEPRDGPATIAPALQVARNRLRDALVSIEGPNEPDISGDPEWIANTRTFQAELYRQVKADPALAGVPVLGPSLVYREARTALGDLSAHLDRGNLHPYPGGLPPLENLEDERQLAAIVSGGKPLVATEIGYHTYLADTGPHRPASEQVVATYTPRIMLEAFRGGIERTYIFQLADLWTDEVAAANGWAPSSNSFGLLRYNLAPKPSFYALRNLMRAVNGDSVPVAAPGGLHLALEGAGPDVRQLLLRSADGSYALVLWRTASVWDRDALRELTPAPDALEVVLGEPVSIAKRFDPVTSDAEIGRWTDPRRIPVELGGAPVVLRLAPPGADGTEATTRANKRRARRRCGERLVPAGLYRPRSRRTRPRCCAPTRSHVHSRKPRQLRKRGRGRRHMTWRRVCGESGKRGKQGQHQVRTSGARSP